MPKNYYMMLASIHRQEDIVLIEYYKNNIVKSFFISKGSKNLNH